MMKQKHIELGPELIKEILRFFSSKKYLSQSFLFYEGQVPISGYLIIDGSVQISKSKKNKKILSKGIILGLSELLYKKPSTISAEVLPNSQLCFLDRTTVQEILLNKNLEVSNSLKDILEIKNE